MDNIFEISNMYHHILDLIENGEEDDDFLLDNWELVEGELQEKVDGWLYIIKTKKTEADALAEEIKRLQGRKKSLEREQLRMKNILGKILTGLGYDKFKTLKHTLYSFKSDKLDIYDSVPDEYKVEYTAKKNDEAKIKEALASGKKLPFARLVNSFSAR